MTNKQNDVFYIGVSNDIIRRTYEHRNGIIKGFTSKYQTKKLVYFEQFSDPNSAINREKQLKNWHRDWKINLIRSRNPRFNDLYSEIVEDPETSSG